MDITQVTTYKDIQNVIGEYPNSLNYFYRGLKKGFDLTPSIAYPDTFGKLKDVWDFRHYEECIITAFHRHLQEGFGIDKYPVTDWTLWFLARHFGLKSRLSDFTIDFTTAYQFATEMSGDTACQIYCLDRRGITHKRQEDLTNPFTYDEFCLIQPSLQYTETMECLGVSRIITQSGKFLNQSIANVQTSLLDQIPLEHWKILEINPEYFDSIRENLRSVFGVDFNKPLLTTHTIDGICHHINSGHLPK